MARAAVSVDSNDNVWGHGVLGELLDGRVWYDTSASEYHYQTFRGIHVSGKTMQPVLNLMAQAFGYTGCTLLSTRSAI